MDIYYNSVSLLYDLALESMHIYNTPCLHCNIVPLIGLTELYMSPDEEFVHIDTCNIYKRYTDSKSVGPNLISYPQLDDRIPYCLLYTEHLTNVHFCLDIINYNSEKNCFCPKLYTLDEPTTTLMKCI